MKKSIFIALIVGIAGIATAQPFTDIDSAQYEGKTKFRKMAAAVDANFSLLEGTPGAKNGATVTADDQVGAVHKTVLTLADTPVVVDGTSGAGFGGTKLYDFPSGRVLVLGVIAENITISVDTNGLDAADGGDVSFGTTVAGDGTLTGTDVDLLPSTSIDPINTATDAALAASAQFDGTSTAKDLYINMLIDDADIEAVVTNTVDATVTIHWINLGDY